MFWNILRLTTNMRESFVEDMFKHSPSIILSDVVLEGFVGQGYGRTKYGIGNGRGKCSGHDDVSLK